VQAQLRGHEVREMIDIRLAGQDAPAAGDFEEVK
jgi:hypothetical protein